MDLLALIPYIERAGTVAAILMAIAIISQQKRIGRLETSNDALQAKVDAANAARIADAQTNIPIVQENTTATKQMNILVQALLEERRR